MTWRRGVLLSVLGTVVVSTTAVPALAASSNTAKAKAQQAEINKKINSLRDQADEVSAESAALLARLNEINGRKAAVEAQVGAVQAQINQVQAELNAANALLAELQSQEDAAQAALAAAEAELGASTRKMQAQAVAAYVGKNQTSNLSNFLLRAEDVREATAAEAYLHQVVQDRQKVVERHRELEGQAKDIKQEMEANRIRGEEARNAVAAREAELAGQKSHLDALNAQVAAESNAQAALFQEVESKRASLESEIGSLQNQSDSIAQMLRNAAGNSGPAIPPGNGILANPVPGSPMTSPFGMRLHPILGRYILHAGQDYGASTGTPIRASANGTVVSAGPAGGYGNYTCIAHGGGLATCYAHQSRMNVSVGQTVVRNQIIGAVGNTGNSTGPHLHFEVRVNGTPVNPLGYL